MKKTALKFRKMSKAERKARVNKYLDLVELQSFANRYPKERNFNNV